MRRQAIPAHPPSLSTEQKRMLGFGINHVAETLSVSAASVRNWIKTGELDQTLEGLVEQKSFEKFRAEEIGHTRLTKRANKQYVENDNLKDLQNNFIEIIKNSQNISKISENYQFTLSSSTKNKEGIYYTPQNICINFFSSLLELTTKKITPKTTFCDPCCGSGNFIMTAIHFGVRPENIYGFDTDPVAIALTRKRIFEATGFHTHTIIEQDFLDFVVSNQSTFNIIFTNPPWGKKLTKKQKKLYAQLFESGHSYDTSSLFFAAAFKSITPKGIIGMLLPEAFFNVCAYQDIRKHILKHQIIKMQNHGRVFEKVQTNAKSIIIEAGVKPLSKATSYCVSGKQEFRRLQKSFLENPKLILNIDTTDQEEEIISYILNHEYITLTGNARWGLGIVTGNNKKFISNFYAPNYVEVIKGSQIHKNYVNQGKFFLPNEFNLYQQVAPKHLYQAKQKIIYRFISSNLTFFHDTEQRYILNSANFFILNNNFKINQLLLVNYLNSELINWLFKKLFGTYKILRSDLETLPIFISFLEKIPFFQEQELLDYLGIERKKEGVYQIVR